MGHNCTIDIQVGSSKNPCRFYFLLVLVLGKSKSARTKNTHPRVPTGWYLPVMFVGL
jgi:hypothetical protein